MVRKMIGLGVQLAATPTTTSSTGDYETLAGIVKIDGPKGDADEVDTSTIDDTNWKTFSRGLADGGEVTVTLAYGSTTAVDEMLGSKWKSGTACKWKTTFPTTLVPAETFNGFVKSMGRSGIEKNSMIVRDITIKVTGDPDFATT